MQATSRYLCTGAEYCYFVKQTRWCQIEVVNVVCISCNNDLLLEFFISCVSYYYRIASGLYGNKVLAFTI